MLVMVLCIMMKILQFTSGPVSDQRRGANLRHRRRKVKRGVKMSVGEDLNSNRTPDVNVTSFGSTTADDYQWFLDYGSQSQHQPASVLSSLAACEELSYYNDLALAEVDMEDFRTEDIHSVLSTLPAMCCPQIQAEHEGEMFASVSGSLIDRFDLDTSTSPHSSSQGYDESGGSTMSICKSELLFSPVRECLLPVAGNFSVDSLDCDELLITCQANKDNYTIAFEASTESEYRDNGCDSEATTSQSGNWSSPRKALDTSMARSESIYTTWSKLRKRSSALQLRRHASGNNNTTPHLCLDGAPTALKSQSLPNLSRRPQPTMTTSETRCVKIYDAQSILSDTNSSISYGCKKNNLSLIKLFMKQKSCSNEGMSVSSVSECWPPSNNSQSDSDSYAPEPCARQRPASVNHLADNTTNGNAWLPTDEVTDYSGFEDSLVAERKHGLIEEEDERSESVEQLSESVSKIDESILDLDLNSSSHSKPKCTIKFNVNNNNSIERSASPQKQRFRRGQGTQTKRLSFASSSPSVVTSSSCSSGEDTEATRIPSISLGTACNKSTQIPLHLIDRSIQTSGYADINSLKSGPFQLLDSPNGTSLVKVIVPRANQEKKPVYVFYPNYTLPDLAFLREKQKDLDVEKVYLLPQKLDADSPQDKTPAPKPPAKPQRRPFSCNDVEALRKKGFSHIQDWDSLTFLLPREYKQILSDVPEIMSHLQDRDDEVKPLFCVAPQTRSARPRPLSLDCALLESQELDNEDLWPACGQRTTKQRASSCDCTPSIPGSTQMSSTSSSATQPSSGYRGSPTMLTDSSQTQHTYNPLFVYHYDSASSESGMFNNTLEKKVQPTPHGPPLPKRSISLPLGKNLPPRPPLPRGILRNIPEHYNCKNHKNDVNKRYSMFEMGSHETNLAGKRRSLSVDTNEKDVDEMEDEGVDAGTGTDSSVEEVMAQLHSPQLAAEHRCKGTDIDLQRLEELLHLSGLSSLKCSTENFTFNDSEMAKLRQQVSRCLIKQDDACGTPNNTPECARKKTVSFAQLNEEAILCQNMENVTSPTSTIMAQKRGLVTTVTEAVERLIGHFTTARNSQHCSVLGDTVHTPAIGQLVLNSLCPALYAIMSDGLKPVLKTSFGDATNSVWQVVEATAQQGVLAKSLNELVLTINTEHVLTEGMVKFNAFVFGLLNVGSVDAWLGFLRTRDSVLRKHYSTDGLFVMANTSGAGSRALIDQLLNSLKLLNLLPFNLDLLFECKQLKESLSRMENRSPTNKSWNFMKLVRSFQTSNTNLNQSKEQKDEVEHLRESQTTEVKPRPRSCVETWTSMAGISSFPDIANTIQKRWSNININSKLFQAFDRLATEDNGGEEEYSDSLEHRAQPQLSASPDNTSDDNTETLSKASQIVDEAAPPTKTEGGKFRRLQMKWEMMSGKDTASGDGEKTSPALTSPNHPTPTKSRIPRLVTSPVRPTPPATTKKVLPPSSRPVSRLAKVLPAKRPPLPRTSRVDQQENTTGKTTAVRPTSLPYKGAQTGNNRTNEVNLRRAASSSRRPDTTTPKFVRTLCHHLASDNGHLTFKEGERLRVVLEVDARWLLCCRGDSKGLVPRTSVIRDSN